MDRGEGERGEVDNSEGEDLLDFRCFLSLPWLSSPLSPSFNYWSKSR